MSMNKSTCSCLLLAALLVAAPIQWVNAVVDAEGITVDDKCAYFCEIRLVSHYMGAWGDMRAYNQCISDCPKAVAKTAISSATAAGTDLTEAFWLGITPQMMCPNYCSFGTFTGSYTKEDCLNGCSTSWAATIATNDTATASPTPAGEAPAASPPASGSQIVTYGLASVVIAFFMALLI